MEQAPCPTAHPGLAILALGIGGFAIGTTEFVTMGLLPEVASGVGIDIPTAGHIISAYALGVVVGAPLLATIGARFPRRTVLFALMATFAVGNLASSFATDYWSLMAARFFSGLPHGAFFGIASLVAASLVPRHRRTWAVSMVLAGLAVANVVGVPLTTVLGQRLGWQYPYATVGLLALLTLAAMRLWVPFQANTGAGSLRAEFGALRRPQVWLTLAIGVVGFGGMFSTFSYITPTLTELTGVSSSAIPWMLALYGLGMTAGNLSAGRLSQRGLLRGMILSLAAIAVLLTGFGTAATWLPTAIAAVFLLGLLPSILVPMMQTRLMDVAQEGQSLAAALNHSTLNTANALGAWLGSLVLAAGYGYQWPSRVGAVLAVLGLVVAGSSVLLDRRSREVVDAPVATREGVLSS